MSVLMPTTIREGAEQVKPLAHANIIDEDEALSMEMKKYHNRTCLKWCGCVSALILILAMIMLILIFTAFHIKDPILKMNSVMIQGVVDNGSSTLSPRTNLTFIEGFSVKNPNVASFKYDRVNTILYYEGIVLAEATTPPGLAKARRTIPVNITIVVLVDDRIPNDLRNGRALLPVSSYTEISGKVKISNIIKKHVLVKMNCTMTVDLRNWSARDQNCKKKVSI